MTKECITNQVKVLVLSWELALMDNKIALILIGLVKVLSWVNLENVITHLETDWLNLFSN